MNDLVTEERASFCYLENKNSRLHGFGAIEGKWVVTACGKWLIKDNTILTENVYVRIPCKICLNC